MKKVLQICAIDATVDNLLKPLILALQNRGFTVHAACSDTGKFASLREQGLHLIHIPIERKINLSNVRSVLQLARLIRQERYDIVHVHTPIAAALGRMAAKLAGTPNIVYTAHGYYFHDEMKPWAYRLFYQMEKWLSRRFTDYLLLQSREDFELSLANRFQRPDRIVHINNGVDIHHTFHPAAIQSEEADDLRAELGIRAGEVVVSFIGRLVREKGIFELMEAHQMLKQEFPFLKLMIIGDCWASERDQMSYHRLKSMLNDSQIIATGYRTDIARLLAVSDVFVLPSYREGLPRSIIEAMAMGKPIVATNIRGCREEVVDGYNGFLVEKENTRELAEKLRVLISDPSLRETFGRRSREIVERSFDERTVLQKQIDLFTRL